MKTLIMRLEGPLMVFGDVAVDETATVARFPAKSMVAGMLANALGYRRGDASLTQALQDSMEIASRIDRPGERIADYQTALISKGDTMWSTYGYIMGRDGGSDTYENPSLLHREYWADASVVVAVAMDEDMIDRIAEALVRPARPIFLGRKSCLPSRPVFDTLVEASNVLEALIAADPANPGLSTAQAQWPFSLGERAPSRSSWVADLKDWANGVHVGSRHVYEGLIRLEKNQ